MPVSSGRTMRGIALNDRNPAISKVGYVLKITEKRGCCKIPQLQWLIKFFNSKLRWQKIRVEMLHTDNKPFREFVKGLKISKEALLIN